MAINVTAYRYIHEPTERKANTAWWNVFKKDLTQRSIFSVECATLSEADQCACILRHLEADNLIHFEHTATEPYKVNTWISRDWARKEYNTMHPARVDDLIRKYLTGYQFSKPKKR